MTRIFTTGAIRDDDDNKFDFGEYFSPLAYARFAEHMRKSAKKYGAGNWRKGIPEEEALKSKRRHAWQTDMAEYGIVLEPEIDHLASEMFNIMIKMHEEEMARIKNLKPGDKLYGYEFGGLREEKI